MRQVDYIDTDGRHFKVIVTDSCLPELYSAGIPIGPPPLEARGLPLDLEVRLNNQLYNRGIFTQRDAAKRPRDLMAALQGALRLDIQRILEVYRDAG